MTKAQLNKAITLYKVGAFCNVCISSILTYIRDNNNLEKSIAIHTFYESIFQLKPKIKRNIS